MHPKVASGQIDPLQNLGVLVLDFFQLYGICFNLDDVGISVNGSGSYYDKVSIRNTTHACIIHDSYQCIFYTSRILYAGTVEQYSPSVTHKTQRTISG